MAPKKVGLDSLFARRTQRAGASGLMEILNTAPETDLISFAGGFPDPATFPRQALLEGLEELIELGDSSAFQYSPTQGLPGPRDFVASRLADMEGIRPLDDQLLLTSGAVEALTLASASVLDDGDLAVIEGPTYLGAIMGLRLFEADLETVPMDGDGLDVEVLEQIVTRRRPKLLYTIPDYQNPTGVTLSLERRHALVDLARRHGFLVVEDVAYRELYFQTRPLPSLWSLGADVVVQIGTFSKTFLPGVRLGWAVGPADIISAMTVCKQNTDQCTGALGQRLLEWYGRSGRMQEQLVRSRDLYMRRRDVLLSGLATNLPPEATWTKPAGGFFTWVTVNADVDTTALSRLARIRGLAFVPGAPFFPDGRGVQQLRLAYSRINETTAVEGTRRLGDLLRESVSGA